MDTTMKPVMVQQELFRKITIHLNPPWENLPPAVRQEAIEILVKMLREHEMPLSLPQRTRREDDE